MRDPERRKPDVFRVKDAISTRYSSDLFQGASVKYTEEHLRDNRTLSENDWIVPPLLPVRSVCICACVSVVCTREILHDRGSYVSRQKGIA